MLGALAIAFGTSAAGNILQGQQARAQAKAQNKMTRQQNRLNAMEAARSIASVRLQGAQTRRQSSEDLATAYRMAGSAVGTARAESAAAGVKGASIDAAAQDVQVELDRAKGELAENAITNAHNMNQQIRQIAVQTRLNFGRMQSKPSYGNIIARSAVQSAMSVGSQYAMNYFNFGAGEASDA